MKNLAIILSVFVYLGVASSQTEQAAGLTDDEITKLSSSLGMKLLLNDTQTTSVSNLLKNYRSDLSKVMSSSVQEAQNKIMSSTNDQILGLLDSKQKMKFNVISPDWWKSVLEAANN